MSTNGMTVAVTGRTGVFPAIIDASKAKRELGWSTRYTSREALREAFRSET